MTSEHGVDLPINLRIHVLKCIGNAQWAEGGLVSTATNYEIISFLATYYKQIQDLITAHEKPLVPNPS